MSLQNITTGTSFNLGTPGTTTINGDLTVTGKIFSLCNGDTSKPMQKWYPIGSKRIWIRFLGGTVIQDNNEIGSLCVYDKTLVQIHLDRFERCLQENKLFKISDSDVQYSTVYIIPSRIESIFIVNQIYVPDSFSPQGIASGHCTWRGDTDYYTADFKKYDNEIFKYNELGLRPNGTPEQI